MPLVQRNGLTFHTQVMGSGAPVCMLHGLLLGSLATWYFGAAPTLARSHRVLLYDLRGHGQSERARTGYGLASMAADLEALLADLPAGPVALVGHSFGALVALQFALTRPERVGRLALVEAPLPPWKVSELGDLHDPEQILSKLPRVQSESLMRQGRAAARLVDRVKFLMTESTLVEDLERETRFDLDGAAPLAGELAALRTRVLCLYGERSSCRPAGEKLARAIPGAVFKTLPGGHSLPVEAPGAVADELVRFLDG